MSLNLSGRPNTAEGTDLRLDEVNRQVQQWLPGNPTFERLAHSLFERRCTSHEMCVSGF